MGARLGGFERPAACGARPLEHGAQRVVVLVVPRRCLLPPCVPPRASSVRQHPSLGRSVTVAGVQRPPIRPAAYL